MAKEKKHMSFKDFFLLPQKYMQNHKRQESQNGAWNISMLGVKSSLLLQSWLYEIGVLNPPVFPFHF